MTSGLSLYWDGYGLATAASGVYVHARSLATELALLAAPPQVIGPPGSALLFSDLPVFELGGSGLSRRMTPLKPVWPQLVGAYVRRHQAARPYVLHSLSNFNLPTMDRDPHRRCVLTVHDIIPFLAPEGVSWALHQQLAWLMPRALRRADAVVCVSEWTKRTLIERYPFVAARCHVNANGLPQAAASTKATVVRPGALIEALYIARFEPYKQHQLLLDVLRTSPLPLRLTLVTNAQGVAACKQAAPDLVQSGRLCFRSGLNQAEVATAHAASDIYLSPSLYEGFGLPAASSLVAGKPVVYLAGSGIDEVVGKDVGVPLAAGSDLGAWHDGIAKGLALAQEVGFQDRVKQHLGSLLTWREAASRLLSLYRSLV